MLKSPLWVSWPIETEPQAIQIAALPIDAIEALLGSLSNKPEATLGKWSQGGGAESVKGLEVRNRLPCRRPLKAPVKVQASKYTRGLGWERGHNNKQTRTGAFVWARGAGPRSLSDPFAFLGLICLESPSSVSSARSSRDPHVLEPVVALCVVVLAERC